MNYKAHIPAGIAFAGAFSLAAGWVAVVPVLIGGAVGGALPDIDIEGSAIEKLGSKSATSARKTVGRLGGPGKLLMKIWELLGHAVDIIFLAPLGKLWRFLSKNVFGRIYLAIYRFGSFGPEQKTLGELLHWNGNSKPWAHRGGITHSFSFMVTSCILTVPIAFIFQSPEFLIGCEAGIVSHLFADSLCKSGTKYFFPFQPKIGFDNENGAGRGRDIRLLPKGLQVSTGKDSITNAELDELEITDERKARTERRLRRREKMWQWIFRLSAVAVCAFLLTGFAMRTGGLAFSAPVFGGEPIFQIDPSDGVSLGGDAGAAVRSGAATGENGQSAWEASGNTVQSQTQSIDNATMPAAGDSDQSGMSETAGGNGNETGPSGSDPDTQPVSAAVVSDGNDNTQANGTVAVPSFDIATAGATVGGVNPYVLLQNDYNEKPEVQGPVSLTKGDLSITCLPRGIVKMPDESLWIAGVGPVTKENLENPKWVFTQQEKDMLLRAAAAQRADAIPSSIGAVAAAVPQGMQDAGAAAEEAVDNATEATGSAAESAMDWLSSLFGGGKSSSSKNDGNGDSTGGGYKGGFLGITEWTESG